ncbi:uncharacterized protein LOC144501696 [Mustelus asterias]
MVNFVQANAAQVQNFVKSENQFFCKFLQFIVNSVQEGRLTKDRGRAYIKEMLHVILFYGQINLPIIKPEEILAQGFQKFHEKYPDVFQDCKTHLPTRPPYTVLLDAIVEIKGTRNAEDVLRCLLDLTDKMDVTNDKGKQCGNFLVSTVISCCNFNDVAADYFGASVTCMGWMQRKVMINILCCKTWHKDIGWAVCVGNTYNEKAFTFPTGVCSMAFNIYSSAKATEQTKRIEHARARLQHFQMTRSCKIAENLQPFGTLVPREPCKKCFIMFPDICFDPASHNHVDGDWEYGNCAECESLSQLLHSDGEIVQGLMRETFTNSPEMLLNEKYNQLKQNLEKFKFQFGGSMLYYNSQA